jgi:hypothetical protein
MRRRAGRPMAAPITAGSAGRLGGPGGAPVSAPLAQTDSAGGVLAGTGGGW